jgi:hypothetical protein
VLGNRVCAPRLFDARRQSSSFVALTSFSNFYRKSISPTERFDPAAEGGERYQDSL